MRRTTRFTAFTTLPRMARRLILTFSMVAPLSAFAEDGAFPLPADTTQLVVVTSPGWDSTTGELRTFERDSGNRAWRAVQPAREVSLGRTGSAWGIGLHPAQHDGPQKAEGDGRSPAGVFVIAQAFGYAASATTGLDYQAMDATDYCIDVVASPLYNTIVDARDVGEHAVEGSTEPMRLDVHADGDVRYRQGFVIQHNPRNVPGGGSCIFAHLWRKAGETTAGCTAMAEPHMQALLGWLRRDARPLFVLLPDKEYRRLQTQWQLPQREENAR